MLCICLGTINLYCQKHYFGYEVQKKVFVVDSIYKCIESEFMVVRDYSSDNEFTDFSYYIKGKDTLAKRVDSFRVKKGIWHIRQNGKWRMFFSPSQFKRNIPLFSCHLFPNQGKLYPDRKIEDVSGKILYVYRLDPKKEIDRLYYTFDPTFGFVSADIGDNCQLVLTTPASKKL